MPSRVVPILLSLFCWSLSQAARADFPEDPPNDPNYDHGEEIYPEGSIYDSEWWLFGFPTKYAPDLGVTGISANVAWQRTIGRKDVLVAILDAGTAWDRADTMYQYDLNEGELPLPQDAEGREAERYDANGDGAFNALDYAGDPRVGDPNGNGLLDPEEVQSTRPVCNGRDGTDGRDAIPTLVALDPIAPGADCPAGGTAILTGPDTNGNGLLDPDEVQSTRPVCNGRDGAGNAVTGLFAITDEPPGANCPAGGTRIDFGLDTDSDGTLSLTEVTQTGYVCNGQDGLGSQAISTIYCAGGLENFPGMSWDYQVQQLANGDVVATASVTDNYITTSRTQYYSLFQVGFLEAPIQLTHDLLGPANYGYWEIKLDRQTLITTITYNDIDLLVNPTVWTMLPTQCIVNYY